jgi:NitT/TauT family transport system permease protein
MSAGTQVPIPPGLTDEPAELRHRRLAERADAVREAARARLPIWIGRIVLAGALVGLWAAASGRLVDDFYVSNPGDVASQLWTWTTDGTLTDNLWITLQELLIGFALGAVGGAAFGIGIGLFRFLAEVVEPAVQAAYSIPKIALMPLFIVWFGIGIFPKILLAAVSVFFIVFFTTFAGVREVDRNFVDVLRVMGAKQRAITRKVVVPSTLTWIFAGLTISVPQAFTAAVAGEILVSNRGIGYLVQASAVSFDTAGVFAGISVILIVAVMLGSVLKMIERRVLRWKAV